jgi:hypothetical protein
MSIFWQFLTFLEGGVDILHMIFMLSMVEIHSKNRFFLKPSEHHTCNYSHIAYICMYLFTHSIHMYITIHT